VVSKAWLDFRLAVELNFTNFKLALERLSFLVETIHTNSLSLQPLTNSGFSFIINRLISYWWAEKKEMKKIIVAIDGFSSCGKSTMAKELAREAGYIYVDTGAMYRAVSLFCLQNGWMTETDINSEELKKQIQSIRIEFKTNAEGKSETYLNGKNVENEIRTLEVANGASRVSTLGFVRRELVRQQQLMGFEKGIVMDGRDIGTVVFPQAELKIFLTASPEIRAKRRTDEMKAKDEVVDYEEVLANVKERDDRDQNRAESPLRKAEDAVIIDNSFLTHEEQRDILRTLFTKKTLD